MLELIVDNTAPPAEDAAPSPLAGHAYGAAEIALEVMRADPARIAAYRDALPAIRKARDEFAMFARLCEAARLRLEATDSGPPAAA